MHSMTLSALALSTGLLTSQVVSAEPLRAAIAADYTSSLSGIFLQLHQHPELSGRESETAKFLAKSLRGFGYQVTEGVGGTGVVAVMKNGAGPDRAAARRHGRPAGGGEVRPALRLEGPPDRLAGIEQPVMHACGHDVHVTALVGAARQLAARKANGRARWC